MPKFCLEKNQKNTLHMVVPYEGKLDNEGALRGYLRWFCRKFILQKGTNLAPDRACCKYIRGWNIAIRRGFFPLVEKSQLGCSFGALPTPRFSTSFRVFKNCCHFSSLTNPDKTIYLFIFCIVSCWCYSWCDQFHVYVPINYIVMLVFSTRLKVILAIFTMPDFIEQKVSLNLIAETFKMLQKVFEK